VKVRAHGRTKYVVEKCRCPVCRKGARDYERERLRHLAQVSWGAAQPRLVDAQPARDHLAVLAAAGIGYKRAAQLAGVSVTVCARLAGYHDSRPANRVRPSTLAKLLAVQPVPRNANPGAYVDATGTGRKVRALVAIGWSQAEIGRRIGVSASNVADYTNATFASRITAGRWVRIDDLWRDLCMTPGPSLRARRHAAARGWPPPLAWDDIDDIDCRADLGASGRITTWDQLSDLVDVGVPLDQAVADVAQRRGIDPKSVLRSIGRAS
jgi:hypothetical protein